MSWRSACSGYEKLVAYERLIPVSRTVRTRAKGVTMSAANDGLTGPGRDHYPPPSTSTSDEETRQISIPDVPEATVDLPRAEGTDPALRLSRTLAPDDSSSFPADSSYIYWVDEVSQQVMRVSILGGSPEVYRDLRQPQDHSRCQSA